MTNKVLRHGLLLVLIVLLTSLPIIVHAESKEIIATGSYIMADGESLKLAQEQALMDAKRHAVEQAGVYLESYTKTVNMQLQSDEIMMLAAGLIQVTATQVDKAFVKEGIQFTVKIKAIVAADQIEELRSQLRSKTMESPNAEETRLKKLAREYEALLADYDKQQQEIDLLKEQLKKTSNEQNQKEIIEKIGRSEQILEAAIWINNGDQLKLAGKSKEAMEAYSKALSFNPENAQAYNRRGGIFLENGQYDQAINDFTFAITWYPRMTEAYLNRSKANLLKGDKLKADADRAVAYRIDPVPDVQIVQPGSDVSPEEASFSGKWMGVWGNKERTECIVVFESIDSSGANVIFVDTKQQSEGNNVLQRIRTSIFQNEVVFLTTRSRMIKLKMTADGTLAGSLSAGNQVFYARFTKVK